MAGHIGAVSVQGTRTSHNRWSSDVGISDARRSSWKMKQQFTRRCAHGWMAAFFNPISQSSACIFSAAVTTTIHCYLYCNAHFAHWAGRHRLALAKIDERATTRFVAEHLPHCDCSYPVKRGKSDTHAALSHLLQTLSACGVVRERRVDWDPLHADSGSSGTENSLKESGKLLDCFGRVAQGA